jgi:hypothetical protein
LVGPLEDPFVNICLPDFTLDAFDDNFDLDSFSPEIAANPMHTGLPSVMPEELTLATFKPTDQSTNQKLTPKIFQTSTAGGNEEGSSTTNPVEITIPNESTISRIVYPCTYEDCKDRPVYSRQCDLK